MIPTTFFTLIQEHGKDDVTGETLVRRDDDQPEVSYYDRTCLYTLLEEHAAGESGGRTKKICVEFLLCDPRWASTYVPTAKE